MAMSTLKALNLIGGGGVIFTTDVEPNTVQILDGMVTNSELCKCQHSKFTWYFAWEQKPSECEADKAHQMAKAIRAKSR